VKEREYFDMSRNMHKLKTRCLQLFLIPLALTTNVYSEEIKLSCKLQIERISTSGLSERESLTEIIEVNHIGGEVFIVPLSNNIPAVRTRQNSLITKVVNFSDQNKWDIGNSIQFRDGKIAEARVVIDRNSGIINTSWKTSGILELGSGICEKVALERRKF
jgi:hypothetical protein